MEHLQRVWHVSRECLPFRTPGSVPHCGTCLCSNCCDRFLKLAMSLLDFSPRIPLGTFSILLNTASHNCKGFIESYIARNRSYFPVSLNCNWLQGYNIYLIGIVTYFVFFLSLFLLYQRTETKNYSSLRIIDSEMRCKVHFSGYNKGMTSGKLSRSFPNSIAKNAYLSTYKRYKSF